MEPASDQRKENENRKLKVDDIGENGKSSEKVKKARTRVESSVEHFDLKAHVRAA